MIRLSGGRMLGKKVLDLGGNAVLGFKQYFDLESEKKCITVRSIGTAVKLVQINQPMVINQLAIYSPTSPRLSGMPSDKPGSQENLEITSIEDEDDPSVSLPPNQVQTPHAIRPQEPVFFTLNQFPSHFILNTGGFVCAASIKLLDNDDREIRDSWWNEVRDEIKSHARTVNCSHVIGYTETTSISEEVAFLYCSGTAVNIDASVLHQVRLDETRAGSRHSLGQIQSGSSFSMSLPNLELDASDSPPSSSQKEKGEADADAPSILPSIEKKKKTFGIFNCLCLLLVFRLSFLSYILQTSRFSLSNGLDSVRRM